MPRFSDHWFVGGLSLALVLTGFVLSHAFFWWVPWFACAFGIGIGYARYYQTHLGEERGAEPRVAQPMDRWMMTGTAALIVLQFLLTWVFLVQRTDRPLASPWEALPLVVFPLFGLSIYFLLILGEALPRFLLSILWFWQLCLAFGVSVFIYQLGFGFDPFIHQAAARHLAERGDIQLPSILYVGQYALEAGLARISGLSVAGIDRILMPLLVALFGAISLPRLWKSWSGVSSFVPTWTLLLLPFLPFTFTVPYHLAYLGLLVTIFALPALVTRPGLVLAGLLGLYTGLVHPLLAIPALVLIVAGWIARRFPKLAGLAAFGATVFGLGIAFSVYTHRLGGVMIWPSLALLRVGVQAVFGFPYDPTGWPWYVGIFYRLFHLWPLLFSLAGLIGYQYARKEVRFLRWVYPGVALAMVGVGVWLAASTRFTNIISTEQFEFALRLRAAAPILFFPGVVLLFERILQRLPAALRLLFSLKIAIFITACWFVAYPQANTYIQRSAPGLSRVDVDTFSAIERLSEQKSYVALTSQMVSAAALRGFGFEHELKTPRGTLYPYAIPTGGALYQQYLRLWYEPNPQTIVDETRRLSGEELVFVAVPLAWDPRGVLHARLAPLADRYEWVDQAMDVYLFEKKK